MTRATPPRRPPTVATMAILAEVAEDLAAGRRRTPTDGPQARGVIAGQRDGYLDHRCRPTRWAREYLPHHCREAAELELARWHRDDQREQRALDLIARRCAASPLLHTSRPPSLHLAIDKAAEHYAAGRVAAGNAWQALADDVAAIMVEGAA